MIDGLVSIIMPSWNTASYIGESIECVLNQTYEKWELLIVDDCSTDNTDEIVQGYLGDPRIKYLKNERNSGAALTRNKALREAQGEWIAFLDSDDLWTKDKLEKQIHFMNENGYDFSYTEYEKIDEQGNPVGIYVSGPESVNKRKMYRYDYIGQLTMMYSAKRFGLNKTEGACCYLLKDNLAKYRIRKKSISHDKLRKKLKSHYDLFHMCDEKPAIVAFWYASWNMFFGILKKKRYENSHV